MFIYHSRESNKSQETKYKQSQETMVNTESIRQTNYGKILCTQSLEEARAGIYKRDRRKKE